jgi:hypothetical protein
MIVESKLLQGKYGWSFDRTHDQSSRVIALPSVQKPAQLPSAQLKQPTESYSK